MIELWKIIAPQRRQNKMKNIDLSILKEEFDLFTFSRPCFKSKEDI